MTYLPAMLRGYGYEHPKSAPAKDQRFESADEYLKHVGRRTLRASINESAITHVLNTAPNHFRERAMRGMLDGWLSGKRGAARNPMKQRQELPCIT